VLDPLATETRPDDSPLVRDLDELCEPFARAAKPRPQWRIGLESEKFAVGRSSLTPLPYHGDRGVEGVFRQLVRRFGWSEQRETADGPAIALGRGAEAITLEPGAQIELSSAPCPDVHSLVAAHQAHLTELAAVGAELDLAWLAVGYHPLARPDELPWVPKARYPIMRAYLPRRGGRALDMMRRTATVQACFDYGSERDAMRKLALALRVSPFVSALFANAPFVEGRRQPDTVSERLAVWTDVDPDRSGLPARLLASGCGFRDYVAWALDVPMFLFKRLGRPVVNTGQTFRQFVQQGFGGYRATLADWALHLTTLFPEVRLKSFVEVRGADAVPPRLVGAVAALWAGLLYDEASLGRLEEWSESFTHAELEALRLRVARAGLRAPWREGIVHSHAAMLVGLAWDGLRRRARLDPVGRDETVHLAALVALVEQGTTPAECLLSGLDEARSGAPLARAILERCQIGAAPEEASR
jgi:glutamate--cysteine ligase